MVARAAAWAAQEFLPRALVVASHLAGRASPDLVTEFKGGKDADAPAQPGSRVGSAGSRRSVEDRLARVEVAVSQQQGLQAELKRCQEQQQELQATMQQITSARRAKVKAVMAPTSASQQSFSCAAQQTSLWQRLRESVQSSPSSPNHQSSSP